MSTRPSSNDAPGRFRTGSGVPRRRPNHVMQEVHVPAMNESGGFERMNVPRSCILAGTQPLGRWLTMAGPSAAPQRHHRGSRTQTAYAAWVSRPFQMHSYQHVSPPAVLNTRPQITRLLVSWSGRSADKTDSSSTLLPRLLMAERHTPRTVARATPRR